MPKPKEITLAEAFKLPVEINELKIDGFSSEWDGTDVISSARGIVRTDRFGHIVSELQNIDALVQGEVAIPNGNVTQVNASVNWPKAKLYIYRVLEHKGKDVSGYGPSDMRRLIDTILRPKFDNLRSPRFFKDFKTGWEYVCKMREKGYYAEGIVLKDALGREYKVKFMVEEKLPIVGHISGSVKGAFEVERNGVICKVSAASVARIKEYQDCLTAGDTPFAEIEYLFLTEAGKMFQPRLRQIGTLQSLAA